jgi:N-acetylglucosaminyl-diphospho-decaprenol L-rhamnosyltransferase
MSDGLTAVIVNWRTAEFVTRAATALVDDGVPAGRIVLVDDGSGDGGAERLAAALPACRVLALPDNLGFARASNAGAQTLPAREAYLFVNSDAFVHRPGSVAQLRAAVAADRVGIAIPRLRNPDLSLQPSVVPFLTPASALVRASGLSRHVPNRRQPALATHWDHGESRDVQSATGAVLAVRSATWRQLGGFDERRLMYVEDHDLMRRAHRAGWRTRFVAEAEFVHLGGASAQQRWTTAERAYRIARAEAEMLGEHLGTVARSATIGLLAAGAGGRALVHGARGDHERADAERAWLRGYLAGRRARSRPAGGGPDGPRRLP